MLGVTAHISTDVAAIPLMWVVPVAIYLATFVIAFARAGRGPTPRGDRGGGLPGSGRLHPLMSSPGARSPCGCC